MPTNSASRDSGASKPFSISFGSRKSKVGSVLVKKRPCSSIVADGSEDEAEGSGATQLVLGFDSSTGTAIGEGDQFNTPLIIAGQKNRSWQDTARHRSGKGRNLLPEEEQARRAGQKATHGTQIEEQNTEKIWGLVINKHKNEAEVNEHLIRDVAAQSTRHKLKTADEEALEALLGEDKKDSGLVISHTVQSDRRFALRVNETDAFIADVESRPDMADLRAYNAVPVGEFGRAMMRGMGWSEGEEIGRKRGAIVKERKTKRRAIGLGIGAKETPEDLELLGAWGKNATKSRKAETHFNPMVMKHLRTGEILTEDEFKTMKETEKTAIKEEHNERREQVESKDEARRLDRRRQDKDHEISMHSLSRQDRSYSLSFKDSGTGYRDNDDQLLDRDGNKPVNRDGQRDRHSESNRDNGWRRRSYENDRHIRDRRHRDQSEYCGKRVAGSHHCRAHERDNGHHRSSR